MYECELCYYYKRINRDSVSGESVCLRGESMCLHGESLCLHWVSVSGEALSA